MRIPGNALWAYVASAKINKREDFAMSMREASIISFSAIEVKDIVVHIDFTPVCPILEVNISNAHSLAPHTDFYTYNPGDLWRIMHSYVEQYAQISLRKYNRPELRLQWNFHNQLITEGTVKLPLPNNLSAHPSDIFIEAVQDAVKIESREQAENPFEAQSRDHQECKCSLCCLTLTCDVPADSDMESFKKLYLESRKRPRDHYKSGLVDPNCSLCCMALASDTLGELDTESLLTLSSGTPGWIQLYADQDFRLVWSFEENSESGKLVSLPIRIDSITSSLFPFSSLYKENTQS